MSNHPSSAVVGFSLFLKFGLDLVHSFGDIVIFLFCHFGLKLPIHAHFWWFWGIPSSNMVTHRFNPQNDHPCTETCRLSHKA